MNIDRTDIFFYDGVKPANYSMVLRSREERYQESEGVRNLLSKLSTCFAALRCHC